MEVMTMLQKVQKDMEDNIYDFTIDGKCSGCGNCCSNLLPMSKKEIKAIHEYVQRNGIKECQHIIPLAKATIDMTCPFRDNGKKICTIYPARPEICRQFICDSKKRIKGNQKLAEYTWQTVLVREEFFK